MKLRVIDWLGCPLCGAGLDIRDALAVRVRAVQEASPPTSCDVCRVKQSRAHLEANVAENDCEACYGLEVETARLVCGNGHAFPVRGGVPRLAPAAELTRAGHKGDSTQAAQAGREAAAISASFSREWGHFSYDDKTWGRDLTLRKKVLLDELGCTSEDLRGKTVLDAGCGNGSLSRAINEFGCEVLAIDVSDAVEAAFRHFVEAGNGRTHFVQGDLMNPPFRAHGIDVIYSSGVLHHNSDTRQALFSIAKALRPGGKVYVWLYHKRPGLVHAIRQVLRNWIAPLPAAVKHYLILCLWLPQSMLRQYVRAMRGSHDPDDRLRWRERLVLLLDHYTPRYRWEHTPEEVREWYQALGLTGISTTEVREWGFGVLATKPPEPLR